MAYGGKITYDVGFNVDKNGLSDLKNQLTQLSNFGNKLNPSQLFSMNPGAFQNINKQARKALFDIQKSIKEVDAAFNNAFDVKTGLINLQKLNASLNKIKVDDLYKKFNYLGENGQKAFAKITQSALTTKMQFKETNGLLEKMGQTLVNTFKWQISSSMIHKFTGAIQEAYGYVKHLDSSLNDIRIVTGKSADEMERFARVANKAAKNLGAATTDYTEASLIYYQQGLGDEEVQARTETTLKAANVTGQSTAEVSEQLTAVWNGYKISAEQTESAVDKLAAVAATTASDLEELSTGMSKVASAASSMGVDMDQLNAQISTIISVTRQAPESVGTALKTIYARIGDLKLGGTDEDGLKLGEVASGLDKLGINVLDAQGDLRDLGTVIEEVAGKWGTWTSAQQAAVAELMAGKRQYNNLIALFDNWGMYESALETSKNAVGTLQKQQDIYMESTEAHLQQLSTQWEDLYDSLLSTKTINSFIDGVTKGINLLARFTDSIGGGNNLFLMLGATATRVFNKQIGAGITNLINNFQRSKENAAQLNAQLNNIKIFKDSQAFQDNAVVRSLVTAQEQVSQYYKILNNEQIDAANELVKQVGEAKQLEQQWNLSVDALNRYVQGLGNLPNLGTQDLSGFDIAGAGQKQIKAITDELQKTQEALRGINAEVKKTDATSNLRVAQKEVSRLQENFQTLEKGGFLKGSSKAIKNLKTDIDNLNQSVQGTTKFDSNHSKKFEKNINNIRSQLKNLIPKEIKQEVDSLLNTLLRYGTLDFSYAKKSLQQFLEQATLQNFVTDIVGAIGALGQFAGGLNSLKGIFDTWNDKSLNFFEKFTSTLATAGFVIPSVVTGFSKIQESVKRVSATVEVATEIEKLNTATITADSVKQIGAKEALALVADEEAAARLYNAHATEIESGKVSQNTLEEIKNLLEKEKVAGRTFGSTNKVIKSLSKLNQFLKNLPVSANIVITSLAGVGTAIGVIGAAIYKAEKQRLKKNYEDAKETYEYNQKRLQALQEEKDKIEELSKSYDAIYKIKNEQNALNKEQQDKIYELVKAYGDEKLIVLALKNDYDALAASIKNANNEKSKELFEQSEATIASGKNMLAAKLKQKEFGPGELLFALSKEQREQFLQKRNELKDSQLAYADLLMSMSEEELSKYFLDNSKTKVGKAVQKYYEANMEVFSKAREAAEKRKTSGLDILGGQYNTSSIKDYESFSSAVSSLANKALVEGYVKTEEEGRSWARDFLTGAESEFQSFADKDVFKATLEENLKFSNAEVEKFLAENSQSAINFLSNNLLLANSFSSLDEFKEKYKDLFNRLEDQDFTFKVKTTLVNSEGKEFKQEDIDNLFQDRTLKLTTNEEITREQFESKSFAEQQGYLLTYYLQAGQLENEFQKKQREGIEETNAARKKALEEQQAVYEEQIEKIKKDFDLHTDTFTDQGYFTMLFGKEPSQEELDQAVAYIEQYKSVWEQGFSYTGDNSLIQQFTEMSAEQQEQFLNNAKANRQYREELKKLGLEYKSAAEVTQDFITTNEEINSISDMLEEAGTSWHEYGKQVQNALSTTNTGIDNLQSAYDSLNSIIEEYNETGKLSIDNLQTFLNMDTAYLSALQIENGQMTLNEDALKQIALARLDEAEAEAYEQAMTELNDEERRKEIEGIGAASQSLVMLGNTAVSAGEAARSGAAGWREYWAAALNKQNIDNDAYAQKVGQALYVKLQAIDAVRQRILSGDLGGALGKSSSSSSGSEKEAQHEEYLERETDLYAEINQELDDVENHLERIRETEEHSWGQSALDALQEENKLLDEQLDKLKEKKKIQEGDLSIRRKQLEDLGATFSEDGAILYGGEDLVNGLYAGYNGMVDTFNAMSADEQESYKLTLETEKDRIDKIEKAVDDYISLYSDYQSVIDEIQKTYYEKIAKDVEEFDFKINLKLELDDAKRDWSDFWHDVINDLDGDDFSGQINKILDNVSPLLGGNGEISDVTNHLNEVLSAVATQISSHGLNGMFGVDTALSKEQIEEYVDALKTKLQDAKGALDGVAENYLKQLDKANGLIDKQIEGWESVGDHLKHNIELIKMISGEGAYDALDKQFNQQYENDLKLLQTQRISKDYWEGQIKRYQDLLNSVEEGSKEWKTYTEALNKSVVEYRKVTQDLDKALKEALNDIKEWYENGINKVTDALDKSLSGNLGLSLMEQEWKLINDAADDYYDNVERWYNMEDYTKVLDEAANTIGLSAENQARLNDFRDKELAQLKAKEKLTQYDIDESKARLEILKTEIALQDAQQNKNKMRLRRDNQGNYTYQYVEDDAAIDQAENGALTAKRDWYELVKKRYKETSDKIIEISKEQIELQKQIAEAKAAGDTEREQKLMEMYQRNQERVTFWYNQAGENQKDLKEGVAQYFSQVDNAEILPQSEATVRTLIDQWAGSGEDSFITAITKAINDTASIIEEFNRRNQVVLKAARVDYQSLIQKGLDPATEALQDLVDTNEELGDKLDENNEKLNEQEEILRNLEDAYNRLEDAASEALQSSIDMLDQLSKASMSAVNDINAAVRAAENAPSISGTSPSATYSSASSDSSIGSGSPFSNYKPTNLTLQSDPYGVAGNLGVFNKDTNKYQYILGDYRAKASSDIAEDLKEHGYTQKNVEAPFELKKYLASMKTGGYTGDWSGSGVDGIGGRIAVLHQKELVLNADDTRNLLQAVNILRDLHLNTLVSSLLNTSSVISSALAGVKATTSSGITNYSSSQESYRNVTVNADFSGVRSADEIYQALIELENSASQTMYSTSPYTMKSY